MVVKDKRGKVPNFVLERVEWKWQLRHQPTGKVQLAPGSSFTKPKPSVLRMMNNQLRAQIQ